MTSALIAITAVALAATFTLAIVVIRLKGKESAGYLRQLELERTLGEFNARTAAAERRAAELAPAPPLVGRTVVVHTRRPDDQTIKGVLVAEHIDRWTLREAFVVTPVGEQPVDGLQHIPTSNIAWSQELQAPEA